jgi:hypothetical protein
VVLVIGALFLRPGWWAPPADTDANLFEQEVLAAIHRIREPDPAARWGMVIEEGAVNGWLATRLKRWVDHDETLAWPEGIHEVQVHLLGDSRLTLAARSGGIVWRVRLAASLEENAIAFVPESAHAGLVPVPGVGLEWILALLPEGSITDDGAIRIPNDAKLADGRRVVVRELQSGGGSWVVVLETIAFGEGGQKPPPDASIVDD